MRITSLGMVCVGLLAARAVRADDFIVYSPHVFASQTEVELRGYRYADSRSDLGGSAAEVSIAHAVTEWWKPIASLPPTSRYDRTSLHAKYLAC